MNRKRDEPLSEVEKFCVDSLIVNGNVDLAYKLSHPNSKEGEYLHVLALRWKRSDSVKAYINGQQGKVLYVGDKTEEQRRESKIDYTQRHNLITALSDAANSEPDTLRKTKILSELADLQRMDKEESKGDAEKKLVHFYLPLRCRDCSLFLANEKEVRAATQG